MMLVKQQDAGEAWMTEEECAVWRECIRTIRLWCRRRGVPPSPLLHVRIRELAVLLLLGRRLEHQLLPPPPPAPPPEPAESSSETTPAKGRGGTRTNMEKPSRIENPAAVIEAVVKHWERTRKAMNELESYCDAAGTPTGLGLADTVKPIMKKGFGVVEESIAPTPESAT